MTRVGEDRAVLHALHVLRAEDALVAGGGHEDVADLGGTLHGQHLEAVHDGLDRLHRIDLGDDHVGAHSTRAIGDTAAAPAIAGDDELATREQLVRGADDPVDRRLPGAIAVVEEVLRLRLVDGDDRKAERTVALERLQPDDTRGRLLRAADDVAQLLAAMRVQDADDVGAVVHRDLRLVVDRGLDVLVVRVVVLALDGEDRDVVFLDERGCGLVLGGQWVGRAEHDVGAARLQRARQVGRLSGDVETGGDPEAGERLLALEAVADGGEDRHVLVGPFDAPHAFFGEREILDVVPACRSHFLSLFSFGIGGV